MSHPLKHHALKQLIIKKANQKFSLNTNNSGLRDATSDMFVSIKSGDIGGTKTVENGIKA